MTAQFGSDGGAPANEQLEQAAGYGVSCSAHLLFVIDAACVFESDKKKALFEGN